VSRPKFAPPLFVSHYVNSRGMQFTVNATGTAISTTVPAGATSGTVQVVTPTGTLSSNVAFRVP